MRIYSEKELKLAPRWFTGAQWKDGTAEIELQREYDEAVKLFKRSKVKRDDRLDMAQRFSHAISETDNKGLSPAQACRKLMGKF